MRRVMDVKKSFGIVLVFALFGCGADKNPKIVKAPFVEAIGVHKVSISQTSDIKNAFFQSPRRPLFAFASGILCRRVAGDPLPSGCEAFRDLPIHANGVTFYLRPRAGAFRHLREKPETDAPTTTAPIPLQVFIPVLQGVGQGPDEEYQLARLQTSDVRPSLVTTDRKWPVAACSKDRPTGTASCRMGFLIRGLNAEVYYSTGSSAAVTQQDLWRVASAIDRKLRTLIIS